MDIEENEEEDIVQDFLYAGTLAVVAADDSPNWRRRMVIRVVSRKT